jgi:hypothetical protein
MIPTTRGSSALLMSIPPNAYDYSTWTADTPTNITLALTTGANGPTAQWTSATASPRAGAIYTTGTRIAGAIYGGARLGTATGGPGLTLMRPGTDNRRINLIVAHAAGVARVYVSMYTDKDTFGATRLDLVVGEISLPLCGRLASRSGNVTAEISYDGGANWLVIYTASDATAFGTAGAGTHVGHAGYTGENAVVVLAYSPYLLVEA